MRGFCIMVAIGVLALLQPVFAEVFEYHPSSPLYLSGGFHINQMSKAYPSCIDHTGDVRVGPDVSNVNYQPGLSAAQRIASEGVAPPPAIDTRYTVSLVQSTSDLYKQLNIDASISARFAFGGGSGSYSLERALGIQQDDVVWVVKGISDYGRWTLRNVSLKPHLEQVEEGEFRERCGTHFVLQERRQAMVAAVYIAHNVDRQERENLEMSFSANASFFGGEYSASFNMREFYEYASSVASVTVNFYALGGEGISKLGPLVDPTDSSSVSQNNEKIYQDFDVARDTIRKYLEKLTIHNSVPTEFVTASFSTLKPDVRFNVPDFQNYALSEMYVAFMDYSTRLQNISALIRDPGVFNSLPEEVKTALQQNFVNLRDKIQEVQYAAKACLEFIPSDRVATSSSSDSYEVNALFANVSGIDDFNKPITGTDSLHAEYPIGTCKIPRPLALKEVPSVRPPDMYFSLRSSGIGGLGASNPEGLVLTVRHPTLLKVTWLEPRTLTINGETSEILVAIEETGPQDIQPYIPPGTTQSSQSATLEANLGASASLPGFEYIVKAVEDGIIHVEYGNPVNPSILRVPLVEIWIENGYYTPRQ